MDDGWDKKSKSSVLSYRLSGIMFVIGRFSVSCRSLHRAADRTVYGYSRTEYSAYMAALCTGNRTICFHFSSPYGMVQCTRWPSNGITGYYSQENYKDICYSLPIRSSMACHVTRKCCLTSINVRIVSGHRLALHNEMVSRPPENILSTATAEPAVLILNVCN